MGIFISSFKFVNQSLAGRHCNRNIKLFFVVAACSPLVPRSFICATAHVNLFCLYCVYVCVCVVHIFSYACRQLSATYFIHTTTSAPQRSNRARPRVVRSFFVYVFLLLLFTFRRCRRRRRCVNFEIHPACAV